MNMDDIINTISIDSFIKNIFPMVSLKNGFFAISGNAASIVPAGQRYLQNYGGAMPNLLVRNIGNAITMTIKTIYLR